MSDCTIPQHICLRCSYKWLQRGSEAPKGCPACKSPYWNKNRTRKIGPRAKRRMRAIPIPF